MEETKRRKLAIKAQKLVELMMVSGIPTASGYEERIRFSELEVVDRGAQEQGLLVNIPEGHSINGWDINVAGVRTTSVKRNIRYHQHAVCHECRQSALKLTAARNSSFESRGQNMKTCTLVVDTANSPSCTDASGWSFRGKSSLPYQEKTKLRQHLNS